jgi:hypothetical protein
VNRDLNPPAVVRPAEDLAALAHAINAEHGAGEAATRKGLEHFRAAGEKLLRAKAQCGHGKWLAWLAANVHFDRRTATRYMELARIPADEWDTVSHLGLRQALEVLVETPHVEGLTVPQLQAGFKRRARGKDLLGRVLLLEAWPVPEQEGFAYLACYCFHTDPPHVFRSRCGFLLEEEMVAAFFAHCGVASCDGWGPPQPAPGHPWYIPTEPATARDRP